MMLSTSKKQDRRGKEAVFLDCLHFNMTDKILLMKHLKEKYGSEEVLVCRTPQAADVPDLFSAMSGNYYKELARISRYVKRCDAEYNLIYLQLIAYVVVNSLDGTKFYVARRIGGDKRLAGKWSFFGGHINPCDMGIDTVLNAAQRELHEETDCRVEGELQYMGMVRDDCGPTPEHLGIVFVARTNDVTIKETDKLEGQWMTRKELFAHYNDFENWGRYIIDYLYEEIIKDA